jgi:hypothetical protein
LHDASEASCDAALNHYWKAWSEFLSPDLLRRAWRYAKPLAGAVEMLKFSTMVDHVGPDYDFNWLPLYGWSRRVMDSVADRDGKMVGWLK